MKCFLVLGNIISFLFEKLKQILKRSLIFDPPLANKNQQII